MSFLTRTYLLPGDTGPHRGEAWAPWQGWDRKETSVPDSGLWVERQTGRSACDVNVISTRTPSLIVDTASCLTGASGLGWIRYKVEVMFPYLPLILASAPFHPGLSLSLLISFLPVRYFRGSSARECVSCAKSLSRVRVFAASWVLAHQALLSMGFSRQEYWRR